MANALIAPPSSSDDILRRRKLAMSLMGQAVQPPDIKPGDPPAKAFMPLIQALGAKLQEKQANQLEEQKNQGIQETLAKALSPVALEGPVQPGQPAPSRPKNVDELAQALSGSPYTREAGLNLQMQALLGRQKAEIEAQSRRQGVEDDIAKMIDPRVVAAKKDVMAAGRNAAPKGYRYNDNGELEPIPGGPKSQLPATALKLQNEELDALGTASNIRNDLQGIRSQLEAGELDLGLFSNLISQGRNIASKSTPESRKFATFRSTLERMRNDSLRLNKGVQTEGDAQRAWNELIANINDPEVVKERLVEIEQINNRAANIRQMNVDVIRNNYGLSPLDTSTYTSQPTPFKAGGGQSQTNETPKVPKKGDIEDGHVFMGGNPADPKSWKKVQ